MENRRRIKVMSIILLLSFFYIGLGLWGNQSRAAEKKYPIRPIQIIMAYNPGASDTYLRPFAEGMAEFLGKPMVFEYKPGAAGTIGASFAAKAKPDGYALFGVSPGPVILGPLTKEGLDYDLDSFRGICRLVISPLALAVKADSPIKNLSELISAAKASPGKLTFSSTGNFGILHFGMEIFQKSAGIKLNHVPTTGTAPAVTALLGGHVDMSLADVGPLKPHVDSGALRLLAVMDKSRMKLFPNVPTSTELGYRVIVPVWYGLMAQRAVPNDVVETLSLASKNAVEKHRKSIEDRFEKLGLQISYLGPEEMDRANREQRDAFAAILKDLPKQ